MTSRKPELKEAPFLRLGKFQVTYGFRSLWERSAEQAWQAWQLCWACNSTRTCQARVCNKPTEDAASFLRLGKILHT